jgi:hypothetical protein
MPSKFIAGRSLTLPPGGLEGVARVQQLSRPPLMVPSNTADPIRFTLAPGIVYAISESESGGWFARKRTSAVQYAVHGASHRNFRWLAYIAGEITCLPLNALFGDEVLTGPFSGCWLAIFQFIQNGALYVGHIGTGDFPADPRTVAVKAAWNAAVDNGIIRPIKAVRPSHPGSRLKPGYRPEVYALITSAQDISTMVWQCPITVPTGNAGETIKIDSVDRAMTRIAPNFDP